MEPGARRLIRENFDAIAPRAVVFGADFYHRLFEAAPHLRTRFPPELAPQIRKLVETLSTLISHLAAPTAMREELHRLGARHAHLHIGADDYDLVSATMIETLRAWLGPAFTPACEAAWTDTLSHVSKVMLDGAGSVTPQRREAGGPIRR